jgi:hypothetical protein
MLIDFDQQICILNAKHLAFGFSGRKSVLQKTQSPTPPEWLNI